MDAAVGRVDVVRRLGEGLRSNCKCGVQARSQRRGARRRREKKLFAAGGRRWQGI